MAESSLSLGFSDFKSEVGYLIGYGRTSGNWTAAQLSVIESRVQSGVRRVYYPPAVVADIVGYEWSWLHPTTTLAVSSGDGDYDLPDDFGRLMGAFHYPANEYRESICQVSVGKLLAMRAYQDLSGPPRYVAIRFKDSTGATGQRQEALFYPEPDDAWTFPYEYEAYSGALSASYPYPLGGMQLSELYMESCLAVVEEKDLDGPGVHTEAYKALLIDAIARDRKRGAGYYGPMGNYEQGQKEFHRGWSGSEYSITYNGDTI